MKINIQLTQEECNAILQVLGQVPYIQVATLIHKIQSQAQQQIAQAQLDQQQKEGGNNGTTPN